MINDTDLQLNLYDTEFNLIDSTTDITDSTGVVVLSNLTPNTRYNFGDFLISWEVKGKELNKVPIPNFITNENETKKNIKVKFDSTTLTDKSSASSSNEDIKVVNGKSAYQIALDNGFVGSEKEWLNSLKGDTGTPVMIDYSETDDNGNTVIHFTDKSSATILKGKDGKTPTLPDFSNWQKVKLTDSKGNILFLSDFDFNTIDQKDLSTGFYYVSKGSNLPESVTNYGYMNYKRLNDDIQRIEYSPFNSAEIYVRNKVGTWGDWETATVKTNEIEELKQNVAFLTQQVAMLQNK